jgi:hypothetical protein
MRTAPGVRIPALLRWTGLVALVSAGAASTLAAIFSSLAPSRGIDFRVYLAAASIGVHAGWARLYDASLQRLAIQPDFAQSAYWQPYVTPPPLAWIVAPLIRLPFPVALALWASLATAAILFAGILLGREGFWTKAFALLLLVAIPQTLAGAEAGNAVCFLILAVAAGWRLARAHHEVEAGLLLGLLALKPQVGLLLAPTLLVAGRWRIVAGMAGSALAFAIPSVITLGVSGIDRWVGLIRFVGRFPNQQSVTFVHLFSAPWLAGVCLTVVVLLCLATSRVYASVGVSIPLAVGLVGSLLIAPYLNGEDYALLAVAALILAQESFALPVQTTFWAMGASAAVVLPGGAVVAPVAASGVVLAALLAESRLRRKAERTPRGANLAVGSR